MAARRATGARKTRAPAKKRRSGTRPPVPTSARAAEKREAVVFRPPVAVPRIPQPTRRAAPAKKKSAAAAKKKSAAAAKKKSAAVAKKTRAKRVVRPTPRQQGVITRAVNQFIQIGERRYWWRQATKDLYERRRAAVIRAFERAGYRPESIRSRLGWISRRRNEDREEIAELRAESLGTRVLDQKTPDGLWVEPDRRRILTSMIDNQDQRFLDFVAAVQDEFGLEYQEAINEWFSPKMTE